jgi:glycosyltransferase involved in cell wall biosynthesis
MRPCLVFPEANRRGGVERLVWESLHHLGTRYETRFVGNAIDGPHIPRVEHRVTRPQWWATRALRPVAFRRAADALLPRDQGTVIVSFGAEAAPGDVLVVNSIHRSWLRRGSPIHFRGVSVPNAARYFVPRHDILLALERTYFRSSRPRAVVAVSEVVADELAELYGVARDRITVIPNGYDPETCNPARRRSLRAERRYALGIDDDTVVLLFVANELHRKGFGVLLDALALLGDAPFVVEVVGRAPLDSFRARMSQLGVEDRVHYRGATSDIGLFHAAADLLVLPTQYEAFSLTVVEALASGLPVVTTSVPGAGDLVRHDRNGLLQHDATDPSELAVLLDLTLDRSRRARWAAAAPEAAAGYDWATLMPRYEQVLLEVL